MSPTTNRRSFTLVELLAVIAIMAVIVAAGLPALKAMSGAGLQTGVRQFSNAMSLARQYAINNRVLVRITLAVDANTMQRAAGNSNLSCRAYSVYWGSNDVNGALVAWWPLQDWRTLPSGVVFSEHNTGNYNYSTANSSPTLGANYRFLGNGSPNWQYFDSMDLTMKVITNIATGSAIMTNMTNSFVEFRPTGASTYGGVGGIRLALGSVISNRTIIITDTSNWAYVEYDGYGGRIRVRYPETWQ